MSTTDIRDLDPKDRRCLFRDEGDLRLYSDYTFTNCRSNSTLGPRSQVRVRSRETAREVRLCSMVSAQPGWKGGTGEPSGTGGTCEPGGSLRQGYFFPFLRAPTFQPVIPGRRKALRGKSTKQWLHNIL